MQLNVLNLGANKIMSQGAYSVADLLLNSNIQELTISSNQIGTVGINAILHAVSIKNRSLKFLDLQHNNISEQIDLEQMIIGNPTLKYLYLSEVYQWSQPAIESLRRALLKNKALRIVSLGACYSEIV